MFKTFNLGDVCSIESGSRGKGGASTLGIPSIGGEQISSAGYILTEKMKYITEEHFKKMKQGILKPGDILLVKDGAKTGKCAFYRNEYKEAAVNEHVFILRANNIILPRLLYYVISSDKFQSKIKSSIKGIIGGINLSIKNLEIYIPDTLAEQQEIVHVLDTMSDIIRLREECISHAQDLIPALFQEMFKEINKYNIDVRQLVNMGIIEKPLDGNHGELHPKASDYVSQGIPFVMASDLINGKVDIYNCNFISEEQAKTLRKGFAKKDDVLISHKGTIGRTAIVQDIDTDYIVLTPQVTYYRILDDSRINKYFLKSYFDSTYFQNILLSKAQKGATRAYVGITEQLSLPIYLPDIKQQEQFANKVREINSYIEEQQEELKNAKQMFQSLLHHAFTGELTRRAYGEN